MPARDRNALGCPARGSRGCPLLRHRLSSSMPLTRLPARLTPWLQGFAAIALLLSTTGCSPSSGNPKVPAGAKSSGGLHAVIETTSGPIELQLLASDAPKAVENFRLL